MCPRGSCALAESVLASCGRYTGKRSTELYLGTLLLTIAGNEAYPVNPTDVFRRGGRKVCEDHDITHHACSKMGKDPKMLAKRRRSRVERLEAEFVSRGIEFNSPKAKKRHCKAYKGVRA